MPAYPRGNICDIINLLNCETIQVNYEKILIHVEINNVDTYKVANFDIAYYILISIIEN